ncbi:hypothetical protein [Bacillus sp. OAE603]|uniref:hypothetical protein n=1 Tax=Gottfriedia sp. OAE603 TaxID=2663872 RepID=UPI00178B6E64
MKKILILWIMIVSGLYTSCHILFGFNETRIIRIITDTIGLIFIVIIIYYFALKIEAKNNK